MQKANNSQMSFGKAKTKKSIEERPDVKFSDVAGVDEAVEEMQEIKDFLANPAKYQSMGAKIPTRRAACGPSGHRQDAAGHAPSPARPACRSSPSPARTLWRCSWAWAPPACATCSSRPRTRRPAIIFIDEIDAVGRQRGAGLGGGHDEREQTLNQLLVEMDGFERQRRA